MQLTINCPLNLPVKIFIFVNAWRTDSICSHWVMLAKRYAYPVLCFADPLALPLTANKDIFPAYSNILIYI